MNIRIPDNAVRVAAVGIPLGLLIVAIMTALALDQFLIGLIVGGWNAIMMFVVWVLVQAPHKQAPQLVPPEAISTKDPAILQPVQPMIETLYDMGFSVFGVLKPIQQIHFSRYEWVFINNDQSVVATVALRRPKVYFVQFATVFHDKTVIHTEYPDGHDIDLPTYRCRSVLTSPEAAYGFHLREMTAFARSHGEPRAFATLDDWREWYRVFANRYGMDKTNRSFRRDASQMISLSMVVTGLVIGLLLLFVGNALLPGILMLLVMLLGIVLSIRTMPKAHDIEKHKPEETDSAEDVALSVAKVEYHTNLQQESRKS